MWAQTGQDVYSWEYRAKSWNMEPGSLAWGSSFPHPSHNSVRLNSKPHPALACPVAVPAGGGFPDPAEDSGGHEPVPSQPLVLLPLPGPHHCHGSFGLAHGFLLRDWLDRNPHPCLHPYNFPGDKERSSSHFISISSLLSSDSQCLPNYLIFLHPRPRQGGCNMILDTSLSSRNLPGTTSSTSLSLGI